MKLQALVLLGSVGIAQAFCPSYCSGHGECTENDICDCFPGFGEADCSVRTCPSGLSWVVGTESELEALPTPNGPAGKHPYTECSSRGACDRATGECECFEGYTGKACRRSACPNSCNGHGLCVADGDIRSVVDGANFYGNDESFILAPQKQYWNAKMSHQCICDQQYTGYDCSTRICPVGLDPTSSCDTAVAPSDVQAVSVLFGAGTDRDGDGDGDYDDDDSDGIFNHVEAYQPHNVEQFLTMTFTSQFNAQYETPPISYWDTAATVQQALISLPNFAIDDVQVYKMFPRDEGNLAGRCAEAYFAEYQSTQCAHTDDCEAMFPSLGAGNVICDVDIQACVETHTTECVYVDGDTEFTDNNCALDFEIDGLYRDDTDADSDDAVDAYYWGHRLTSFERNCQAGKFAPTDTKYALACTVDADCVPCAGWTQVTNGLCNGDTGMCDSLVAVDGPSDRGITDLVTPVDKDTIDDDKTACGVATFVIKFSDESTQGVQNDLACTITNTDATMAGASPMYRSSGLDACEVTHIGVPEFLDGSILDNDAAEVEVENELSLCYLVEDAMLSTSMVAAADCTGALDFAGAFSMTDINDQVSLDNGNVVSVEGGEYPDSPSFVISGVDAVYTIEELTQRPSYDTAMPCSNKGACDYSSGMCDCQSGYTGAACNVAVTYV